MELYQLRYFQAVAEFGTLVVWHGISVTYL